MNDIKGYIEKLDKSMTRKESILFLDYDGVVNTPMWNDKGTKCTYNYPSNGKVNNFQAVQWVSEFCQQCHYSIVVTSTWRKDKNWRECLINGGLRKDVEIIGCTDIVDIRTCNPLYVRGEEIASWLKHHPEIKYYIIVDDDNDMLPQQQSHFVQTETTKGFGLKEYQQCLKIYERDKGRGGSYN